MCPQSITRKRAGNSCKKPSFPASFPLKSTAAGGALIAPGSPAAAPWLTAAGGGVAGGPAAVGAGAAGGGPAPAVAVAELLVGQEFRLGQGGARQGRRC